jgi:hypothetical protein
VRLSLLGTSATIRPMVQVPDDDAKCEAVGGVSGERNRSTCRKPAPVPLLHRKSPMSRIGLEPGPPRWESGDYPP